MPLTPTVEPVNDSFDDAPLPRARCGTCAHWCESYRGGSALGECMVRPGSVRTYTVPTLRCDVNHGGAWTPRKVPA